MHIIVSWDVRTAQIYKRAISKELRSQLDGFSWVKPLSNLYIVKLNSIENRQTIRQKLIDFAREKKAENKSIRIVISPVIMASGYSGFLGKDMWEKINRRTIQDA